MGSLYTIKVYFVVNGFEVDQIIPLLNASFFFFVIFVQIQGVLFAEGNPIPDDKHVSEGESPVYWNMYVKIVAVSVLRKEEKKTAGNFAREKPWLNFFYIHAGV